MALTLSVDPNASALLRAVGLLDRDGRVDQGWFDDPLGAARSVLTDPAQRAALLELLENALPGDEAVAGDGTRWHPLLEPGGRGNVYLTVAGDVIGFAGRLETPAGIEPRVSGSLRLPLVDAAALASGQELAPGPLEVELALELGPGALARAIRVRAGIGLDGKASFAFRVEDVDLGEGPPRTLDIDSAHLGPDLLHALQLLLRDLAAQATSEPAVGDLVEGLLGLLGLDGTIPPLPFAELVADPSRARGWLASIASDPGLLRKWIGYLARLVGAPPPPAAGPIAFTVFSPAPGVELVLRAEAGEELRLGLAVVVKTDTVCLEGAATALAIPLATDRPLRLVPEAAVRVRVPGNETALVDAAPGLVVGALSAGLRFDGVSLAPELVATGVVLEGTTHARLDLTDAGAVIGAVSAGVRKALEDALGDAATAVSLLALLGLLPPRDDTGSTRLVDVAALAQRPTRAFADVHRRALAAGAWGPLFGELAALLGLTGTRSGSGTEPLPWRIALAGAAPLQLDLVAWNARDGAPAGEERLRIGLEASATNAPWDARLRSEILAFDLPADGEASVRLVGEQRLTLVLAPVAAAASAAGIGVRADEVRATAAWAPGTAFRAGIRVEGIHVSAGADDVGPLALAFPPAEPSGRDLGLGIAVPDLLRVLRMLASHALVTWGGEGVHALGDLLGLHDREDWPRLEPPDPGDLGSLFERPGEALLAQLRRIALEVGADGTPYAAHALARAGALLRGLPARAGEPFAGLDVPLSGAGTPEAPWALPLVGDGADGVEVIAWLEPAGPPLNWIPTLVSDVLGAADARTLERLVPRIGAFLPDVPPWLGTLPLGDALERLSGWLADGDGLVPLASQLPDLPGWRAGAVLGTPHDLQPRDPEAIAQIQGQLASWQDVDGGRAVLFVGPPWSSHAAWNDALAALEPARPAGAHFALRDGGFPEEVEAVAAHYTVDLLDAGAGDLDSLVGQLAAVVDRVAILTGRSRVVLVAHSTAGVAARLLAARRPEAVRGIITLGTPHSGIPRAPLLEGELAEAARAARALCGDRLAGTFVGTALDALVAAVDGTVPSLLPSAFATLPDGTASDVPGLALGSSLGGALVSTLASAVGARLASSATGAGRPAPTHVGLGLRARVPFPASGAGGIAADAALRLDALRIPIAAGAAEPARPARSASLRVRIEHPGSWLVGEALGPAPRVRSAELGLLLVPSPGGVIATPSVALHDVVLPGMRRDLSLGDADLAAGLTAVLRKLEEQATGTPAALVLDLARAAGLTTRVDGALRADRTGLEALVQAPATTLLARKEALLDSLERALPGGLAPPFPSLPISLSLDRATGALRLRTTSDLPLGEGVSAALDARLDLGRGTVALDATLVVGAVRIAWSSADGRITVEARPWLSPLVLLPPPTPAELRAVLAPLVPRLALSSALSIILGELLGKGAAVGPLDALLSEPATLLDRLDGDALQPLLQGAARALGVDDAGGLALPGGFVLSASGAGSLRLALAGRLSLGSPGDTLALSVALQTAPAHSPTVEGGVSIDVAVPGGAFGRVKIEFSMAPDGVGLSVTPGTGAAITLLPRFSGLGALAGAGASLLLPRLLQALVDELRPASGPPTGVLAGALGVAEALGIYAEDAAGFETPARAARLAAMLQPGFLEGLASSAPAILGQVATLFGPAPLLEVPGTVSRNAEGLSWEPPIPGIGLGVSLGWGATGPRIALELDELQLGPVIGSARLGWAGELAFSLAVGMKPDGFLAFLRPSLALGIDAGGLSVAVLPLGETGRADAEIVLCPAPAITLTEGGMLGLVTGWGLPLVSGILLRLTEELLDKALWPGGPTAQEVLEEAGLVEVGSSPPAIVTPLPALGDILLGALQKLATAVEIDLGDQANPLVISVEDEPTGDRLGLRISGRAAVGGDDLGVTLRFGDAPWLQGDGGVTLWLLQRRPGAPIPIAFTPGLQIAGLGATFGPGQNGEPLVGGNDGAVQIGKIGGLLFLDVAFLDANREPALEVTGLGGAVEIEDARIAVDPGEGDTVVKKLLPAELQSPFSLGVSIRDPGGLEFHGSIGKARDGIELTFPLELDLSFIRLRELWLAALREQGLVVATAAISGDARLGPLSAVVERVGLRARIGAGGAGLEFKPPDGFGISLDTSAVRVGGYLEVDERNGRYVGAIDIAIVDTFSIVAVGIATTKRPDGSPLFSLLLLIAVEFPAGLPLGYNFYLKGVGGLLGLNRGMDLDRLRSGLRNGTADSILFPTDILPRIDAIVRDLEEAFPIAEGRFLVAPMVKIEWSSPALITAKVGLVIDIGDPFRLAILGVLRLALPEPEEAVLDLKVAFLGAIDLGASLLSFDASIYDSYLGYGDFKLSLEGDIAFRVCWGARPDFVTSVGGFHPLYHPGAHLHLPNMRRMSLSLLKDNPRITLTAYMAVTSNSVQFGGRLELLFKSGDFSIVGDLGLDVLVQVLPLYLNAHVWARLAVECGGDPILSVSLDLSLEGPTPWIAAGKASFTILCFDVTAEFETQFGEAAKATVPLVAVLPEVVKALEDAAAWTALLPEGMVPLVQLRPPSAGALVLDASGALSVAQRILPLATEFTLFGVSIPSDARRVEITELHVGKKPPGAPWPTGPEPIGAITDLFAPAAFRAMSDADKLRATAYEPRPSGIRWDAGTALRTDDVVVHAVAYERIVVDGAARAEAPAPTPPAFASLADGGAAGRSRLAGNRGRQRERKSVLPVEEAVDRYAVVGIGDLRPLDATGAVAAPLPPDAAGRIRYGAGILLVRSEAEARRNALRAAGRTDLHVVPEFQLAA